MTWLPFELHPDTPSEGVRLADYFGFTEAQMRQMHLGLQARAEQLGLPMQPPTRLVNTHKALLLAEFARDADQFGSLHGELFRAYWVRGQDLADEAVLREAAEHAGLDPEESLAAVRARRHEDRLVHALQQARAYGIAGAPTFIINGRYKIVGAQPYERLRDALRQIARQSAAILYC